MASPRATMEARLEDIERDLNAMERRQKEQGKAMELIAQQLGQLLMDRRMSPPAKDPPQRRNLERKNANTTSGAQPRATQEKPETPRAVD